MQLQYIAIETIKVLNKTDGISNSLEGWNVTDKFNTESFKFSFYFPDGAGVNVYNHNADMFGFEASR